MQQFTVPSAHVPRRAGPGGPGGPDPLAFRVLFTPTAVVLTRDAVPICEFAIR